MSTRLPPMRRESASLPINSASAPHSEKAPCGREMPTVQKLSTSSDCGESRTVSKRACSASTGMAAFACFSSARMTTQSSEVTPSCKKGYKFADINACLPPYVCKTIVQAADIFAKKIPVFNSEGSVLSGVETRTSSPVRIMRDEKCDSSVYGLMPCGEGAGYAGGITSSAAETPNQKCLRRLKEKRKTDKNIGE